MHGELLVLELNALWQHDRLLKCLIDGIVNEGFLSVGRVDRRNRTLMHIIGLDRIEYPIVADDHRYCGVLLLRLWLNDRNKDGLARCVLCYLVKLLGLRIRLDHGKKLVVFGHLVEGRQLLRHL